MKTTDPERFEESMRYQQGLLDQYFLEYVGKAANDNVASDQLKVA